MALCPVLGSVLTGSGGRQKTTPLRLQPPVPHGILYDAPCNADRYRRCVCTRAGICPHISLIACRCCSNQKKKKGLSHHYQSQARAAQAVCIRPNAPAVRFAKHGHAGPLFSSGCLPPRLSGLLYLTVYPSITAGFPPAPPPPLYAAACMMISRNLYLFSY